MGFRGKSKFSIASLFACLLIAPTIYATNVGNEKQARQILREKILRVGQDLEMKEFSYQDSRSGGGKETNANDRNSFVSNTTYHSYVWDYCLNWMGGGNGGQGGTCQQWLHPYVSMHGAHGDRSPLEGEVYNAFLANQTPPNAAGQGGQYGIWDVEAQGNYIKNGVLDREKLTGWRIKKDIRQKIEKIGRDTAQRTINNSFQNGEARDGSVLPNMESLRRMAGRFTKMYRNRMLANIGEIRAAQPGIEVGLGEDIPECQDYMKLAQQQSQRRGSEFKLQGQNRLDIQTKINNVPPDKRMQLCQQARAMSAYAVNVRPQMGSASGVQSRGVKNEWIDGALSRAALMTVDFTGIDPKQAQIDPRIKLREEDVKSKVTIYEDGAKSSKEVLLGNGEVLNAYNQNLRASAQAVKKAAAVTGRADRSGEVTNWQIKPGTMNMVKLNDLTPEMRTEVSMQDTSKEPGDNLETKPADLTIKQK